MHSQMFIYWSQLDILLFLMQSASSNKHIILDQY